MIKMTISARGSTGSKMIDYETATINLQNVVEKYTDRMQE